MDWKDQVQDWNAKTPCHSPFCWAHSIAQSHHKRRTSWNRVQDGNTLQEKHLPPLNIYLRGVTVKAGTRSRREMSCILNLCTLQLFVFNQSPTAKVFPSFVSVMTDLSYTRHTICRNSSLGHEEVHENLLQDASTVWWCWWQRLSVTAYTDRHHMLLLQQLWQQKAVFRAENGLDNYPFNFFSIMLFRADLMVPQRPPGRKKWLGWKEQEEREEHGSNGKGWKLAVFILGWERRCSPVTS